MASGSGLTTNGARPCSFIDEVDLGNGGLLPDALHMNIEEVSLAEALRSTGDRVLHVQFTDSSRHAAGEGHIHSPNWPRCFERSATTATSARDPAAAGQSHRRSTGKRILQRALTNLAHARFEVARSHSAHAARPIAAIDSRTKVSERQPDPRRLMVRSTLSTASAVRDA